MISAAATTSAIKRNVYCSTSLRRLGGTCLLGSGGGGVGGGGLTYETLIRPMTITAARDTMSSRWSSSSSSSSASLALVGGGCYRASADGINVHYTTTTTRRTKTTLGLLHNDCYGGVRFQSTVSSSGGGGGGSMSAVSVQSSATDEKNRSASSSTASNLEDFEDENENTNNDNDGKKEKKEDLLQQQEGDIDITDSSSSTTTITTTSTSTSTSASTSSSSLSSSSSPRPLRDYTSDKSKSGTPSPWALFDAWGVAEDIQPHLTPSEQHFLSPESVMIPFHDDSQEGKDDDEQDEEEGRRTTVPDETSILQAYDKHLRHRSSAHFGYPYNLIYNHEELYEFMKYSINNLGDPFVTSNYGVHSRQFECAVIDFFAKLWKMPQNEYWGYVTTCGTEGNLHGILLARECHPNGILYSSKETHYSVFKAARYYRMDAKSIPTLPMGEIDYDVLAMEIQRNKDRPVIINVNIGTTVKGAVDNLDRILRILKSAGIPREQFHIHCDGALFAMMMPFVDYAPTISFEKPIDSIAVSGHKMLGCPMPCGIALARKEHVKKVEQRIDYLNSVDTTIMGSRNGQAALYLWYSLRKKGIAGIKQDVVHCMETAKYLRDKITTDAEMSCRLNDLSSTVVLERPLDDEFVQRWQLACEEDIAHVVVMPNVTKHKIDTFVTELKLQREKFGRRQPLRVDSPLAKLTSSTWGGSMIAPIGDFPRDA